MAGHADQQPLHQKDKSGSEMQEPMPKKKSCTGFCCYKALTVIYCLFFFIIGVVVMAVGSWVVHIKQDYESINDILSSPAILAIVVGVFMVITAIIGLVGAAKEHLLLLRIFLGIVIIVFILQVIIGIIAFVYREETINVASSQLHFAINEYTNNDELRRAVNALQQKFECCGLKGPNDWDESADYRCGANSSLACSVPQSCCKEMREGCGTGIRDGKTVDDLGALGIYTNGCSRKFLVWLESRLDIVGATALGLALLHVLGIFLVYIFCTAVEDRQWLFKYRKRYYQNS